MEELAYVLMVAGAVFLFIDWRQTLYIVHHPMEYMETNRFLGPHPTESQVNRHFLAWGALLAFAFVTAILIDLLGLAILEGAVLSAVEAYYVANNYKIGIRV